jgi:LPXTG-site transpeptidase (sortase) family protein
MAKKKSTPTKLRRLPDVMMVAGILLIILWGVHRLFYRRSLSFDAGVVDQYATPSQQVAQKPIPTHIYAQWCLDVDIKPEAFDNGEWGVSSDVASYLIQSARPGEAGNIILYGHNTRKILGNIRAFKGYETITLTLSDGSTREYKIESMHEVSPQKVEYLSPTDTETLTIYTCSGLMDAKRFVVVAKPI